ncbi:MAG: hypothetical protein R6X10_09680 [Desulfobacterales bacterium]
MKSFINAAISILFLTGIILSCESSKTELSFQDIPHYPASIPEQHMEGSGFSETAGEELKLLSTTDPFKTVVAFYTDELNQYNPEVISQASEPGRQTAITVKQGTKVLTVVIKEHGKEGRVVITHMAAGE